MASNIVPGNIDGTFPVAGQDNSSQGFRDNFTATKNNFTTAQSEITALQSNKASLNASSDFADNIVSRMKMKDNSEVVYPHGSVNTGTVTIDHSNGQYQTITIGGAITFAFTNWAPTGNAGRVTLQAQINTGTALTLPTSVKVADNVSGGDGSSKTLTMTNTGLYVFEFISVDAGTTILMHQLGKQYT